MRRRECLSVFSLAFLCCFPVLSAAGSSKPGTIKIMASIFPLKEFAAAVAGERGDVRLLLPPGSGVHTWQPRAGDLLKLAECDLMISIGANLEPWLKDLMKGLSKRRMETLHVIDGLNLAEDSGLTKPLDRSGVHSVDPHIWLDFEMAGRMVDLIREKLSSIDPEGTLVFQKNAEAYKDRLQALDKEFKSGLEGCRQKTFIMAGHAAFGYLAKRYGLIQIALYGLSPDAQITPSELIEVIEKARNNGTKAVFFETTVSPELARTLARELEARILVLNPGDSLRREDLQKGRSFFDIMEENLRNLENGLDCR